LQTACVDFEVLGLTDEDDRFNSTVDEVGFCLLFAKNPNPGPAHPTAVTVLFRTVEPRRHDSHIDRLCQASVAGLSGCGDFARLFDTFAASFDAAMRDILPNRAAAADVDARDAYASAFGTRRCAHAQRQLSAHVGAVVHGAAARTNQQWTSVDGGGGFGFGFEILCGCEAIMATGMGFGHGFTAAPLDTTAAGGFGGGGGLQLFSRSPTGEPMLIAIGGGGGGSFGGSGVGSDCGSSSDGEQLLPAGVVRIHDVLGRAKELVMGCPAGQLAVIGGGGGGSGFSVADALVR
jgi:hypothetical protein